MLGKREWGYVKHSEAEEIQLYRDNLQVFQWWPPMTWGISWDEHIPFSTLQIWLSKKWARVEILIKPNIHVLFPVLNWFQSLGSTYHQTTSHDRNCKYDKNQHSRKSPWLNTNLQSRACFLVTFSFTLGTNYTSLAEIKGFEANTGCIYIYHF